jgi:hypothetical protein
MLGMEKLRLRNKVDFDNADTWPEMNFNECEITMMLNHYFSHYDIWMDIVGEW